MSDEKLPEGYNYICKVTVEGYCKETKKPVSKVIDVKYYAGNQEPDTTRIIKKTLRAAVGLL